MQSRACRALSWLISFIPPDARYVHSRVPKLEILSRVKSRPAYAIEIYDEYYGASENLRNRSGEAAEQRFTERT